MKTVVYTGLRFEGSQKLPKGPGSPRGPSERQMNQESLMEALLGDKNMQEKTRSWRVPGAEPCVFTIFLISMFPKPFVFAVVLARFGLAAAQWIAAPTADFLGKTCKN